MKYAEILLPIKFSFDKETLTYEIPINKVFQIGQIVEVEVKNKIKRGIIIDIHNNKPNFRTKEITSPPFGEIIINEIQISLLKRISKYYLSPLHKVIKLFIPKKIFSGKIFKEIAEEKYEQIYSSKSKILNSEQTECIKAIKNQNTNKFLIQGVTGSGKTEIYVSLAKEEIENGKQALILVPEISLTTQTVEYFEQALGEKATVFNSKLSEKEKFKNWINVVNGRSKLIIGSRSAIFSPFKNLGVIIIDEEHDASYKQDNCPRYNAKIVAEMLTTIDKEIKLILGSATPTLETLEKYKNSKFIIKNRINNTLLPEIEIIDLRDEFHKRNFSIFSEQLKIEINKTIQNNEQAILFINRRGSASSIVCRDCGFVEKCQNCEIPMTFHQTKLTRPTLICHHCGKIASPPKLCKNCNSHNIRQLGIGTEKIESDLKKEFPSLRILRADKDTTSQKNGFKEIYNKFKRKEADILVGTQMIAKGLHLPSVSLVAVILADIGLNIPDFRNNERIYQLITQVSGRSGRGEKRGKVIIQTYNPNHISLTSSKNYDFENFIKYERSQRQLLKNPPFSNLVKIIIEESNQNISEEKCENLKNKIEKIIISQKFKNIEISTYPAYIYKLKNKYRNILLIKDLNKSENIHKIFDILKKEGKFIEELKIDIDPLTIS